MVYKWVILIQTNDATSGRWTISKIGPKFLANPRAARRYNKSKKATTPFASKVNQVIARSRETKLSIGPPISYTTNDTLAAWTDFSTAITGVGEIYSLLPCGIARSR